MMRKLMLLWVALALAAPVTAAQAAPKKSRHHVVIASKHKHKLAKHYAGHSRVNHTMVASNSAYKLQKASYKRASFQGSYNGIPRLASTKALIVNQLTGEILYAKSTDAPTPIASVTKLMTAMVMLDAHQAMDETLIVTEADVDTLKGTHSRLPVGTQLTRGDFLQLAIMSSENRAASTLGRNYPGGLGAFVVAMNAKARALGMTHSHFVDPTGLNSENFSTAADLVKMVQAACLYPQIRQVSTTATQDFPIHGDYRNAVSFSNTNALVRNGDENWTIGLSKTGFINEAGRCLVMQAEIAGQPLIIVLLDSSTSQQRIADAQRIRKWIENGNVVKHLG